MESKRREERKEVERKRGRGEVSKGRWCVYCGHCYNDINNSSKPLPFGRGISDLSFTDVLMFSSPSPHKPGPYVAIFASVKHLDSKTTCMTMA
jgi:hypothetical protein